MTGWSYGEVEAEFLAALEEAGIPPNDSAPLRLDGKKHRYRIRGQRSNTKNGEYCVYMDERPAGFFKSYSAGDGVPYGTWCMSRQGESFSPEEKARYFEEARQRKELREKEAALLQEKAVQVARGMWEASTPIHPERGHGYLKKKKLPGTYGARQLGNDLIIPLMDGRDGQNIQTVQTIKTDGEKRFVTDAPKWGNFYLIESKDRTEPNTLRALSGEAEPPSGVEADCEADGAELSGEPERKGRKYVWICEGFATGATLHELSGLPVVVAVDAGNIMPVVRNVRELHPEWSLLLAPDWDGSTGNAGMARAFEVYEAFGVPMVPPQLNPGEGSDWNDLYVARGFEKAQAALREGLKRALADPELPRLERENLFVHLKESGGPKKTQENLARLLAYLEISVRYNMIAKQFEVKVPGRAFSVDNEKNAVDAYMTSKCVEYGLAETTWERYAWIIADDNAYNPVRDWILSRPWDGRSRLLDLIDTLETPASYPDDLKEILITKWLTSAVAAVFIDRGFHCRGVLVLQGEQSKGKTSWFKRLVPASESQTWFGEGMTLNVDNKDSVKMVVSKWITELGELEGTFKKSDLNRLKGFVTSAQDELRLPYARVESQFPRRTVFAASVNDKNFLIDETGNTRWWCIECLNVDYLHDIDQQQLFAEVYENLFRRGEPWWLNREEEIRLEEQNGTFKVPNLVDDLVRRKLNWDDPKEYWSWRTVSEILIECGIEKPTPSDQVKAAHVIRKITGKGSSRSGHNGARVYFLPTVERRPSGEKEIVGEC